MKVCFIIFICVSLILHVIMHGVTPGAGTSSNFRYPGTAHEKKWTQSDLSFCKYEWSKNLKLMEKRVNWIENEGKIDTKCLKSVK